MSVIACIVPWMSIWPDGIEHRFHFFGDLAAEAAVGQADDPRAVDRAIDLPAQARQQRVRGGLAAEEGDGNAVGQILVDQHRDVLAVLQRLRQQSGASRPAGTSVPKLTARIFSMARSAASMFGRRNRIVASSPCAAAAIGDSSQLPRWRGKEQCRLAVVAQFVEQLLAARRELDAAWLVGIPGIMIPDAVDMREFGPDASEVVPDAGQDLLDLLRRLFGEGGREVLATDAILAQPAADEMRAARPKNRRGSSPDRNSAWCAAGRSSTRQWQRWSRAWQRHGAAPWCEGSGVSSDEARPPVRPARASGSARRSARRTRTSSTSRRSPLASRALLPTTSNGIAGSGTLVIDRRRNPLMLEREQREDRLDRAGGEMVWPTIDLFDDTGMFVGVLAEHRGGGQIFHLVVFRRRRAVRVDVIDLLGLHAGVGKRLPHAADRRLAVGARSGCGGRNRSARRSRRRRRGCARRAPSRHRSFPAPARRRLRPSRSRRGSSRTALRRPAADRSGWRAPTAARSAPWLPD